MSDVESLRTVDSGWSYPHLMDKETLIRLAQPAATALLAISISTVPLIAQAQSETISITNGYTPLRVEIVE